MVKKFRGMIKNQKGLTLVELLAVIVILGILAAIAVPSIGGIIDNSKKDAHIANAKQMHSAARMAFAGGEEFNNISAGKGYTLKTLIDKGYIEPFNDPDNGNKLTESQKTSSYILLIEEGNGNMTYKVYLVGAERSVEDATTGEAVDPNKITRDNVIDN